MPLIRPSFLLYLYTCLIYESNHPAISHPGFANRLTGRSIQNIPASVSWSRKWFPDCFLLLQPAVTGYMDPQTTHLWLMAPVILFLKLLNL